MNYICSLLYLPAYVIAFKIPLSKRVNLRSHSALAKIYETAVVSNNVAQNPTDATRSSTILKIPKPEDAMAVSKSAGSSGVSFLLMP